MGYTKVREYRAGKKDWREAGLPMERDGQIESRAPGVPAPGAPASAG